MKKTISLIILFSMMLHCMGRLGFLNYIYQERHNVALSLGLIQEKPIAICNHEYNFREDIQIQDDGSESLPVHFPLAQEINLFTAVSPVDLLPEHFSLLEVLQYHPYSGIIYNSPLSEIFQPPRLS